MSANKNERVAKTMVAMNLIEKTETGFIVHRPAFWGQKVEGFHVAEGKCDCFGFEESGTCPHVLAAEMVKALKRQQNPSKNVSGVWTKPLPMKAASWFTALFAAGVPSRFYQLANLSNRLRLFPLRRRS
jgi:hypothetical protein